MISITTSILYFNFHENAMRMETRKKSAILDHWGKGAPSKEEIAALEESLRREMQAFEREEKEEGEEGLPSPPQQETGTQFNGKNKDLV